MANELQIFNNTQFGQVRWIEIDSKHYAVGIDVAKSLGYKNPNDAITRHCKGYVKHAVPTESGTQTMNVITEGDIYRLTAKSELPGSEKFEAWIFDEVLPQIRKTGQYSSTPQIDSKFLYQIATQLEEKEKQIQLMQPKSDFYDAVAGSKDAIEMSNVAKVLAIKGYGRNNLFEFLRTKGILDRDNVPYQTYVDRGYFRVLEQKYNKGNGETAINIKTLVYQKGLDYIRKLIS